MRGDVEARMKPSEDSVMIIDLGRAGAVTLTASGRKAVLRTWERRMTTEVRHPLFGYTVSYRRAVELQARILAAQLIGELPQYEPLVTR